jgi:hypothetical protein
MSIAETIFCVVLPNLLAAALMWRQHKKHIAYKDKIHALLGDGGFVEGEPATIIDEALRVTANLKMPEPNARDFAHALIRQECFRKAIAHEELHRIYVETHGVSL